MISLSVDDRLAAARAITDIMKHIDPEGTHEEEKDPVKALEKVVTLHPDIVWLDIEMAGMNGLELAAKIKKQSPFTNIVFVSGHPEYAMDGFSLHVSGFLVKPVTEAKILNEIVNLRRPVLFNNNALIRVQCFGNFEVLDRSGKPLHFSRTMSKEAFAYLINKRGTGVSVAELCAVLWEDRCADAGIKAQCRSVLRGLKMDLKAVGAESVLIKEWNAWSVNTAAINCDYYNFLQGDSYAVNSFRGEFMSQYSWAEMTIGSIVNTTSDYFEVPDDWGNDDESE